MANTLRFKRGLVSTIPTALAGEPLFTTDTFDLYIGNGTTNTRFQKYIASGTTSQLLRGDGSLLTMPIVLTSPSSGQVLKYNGTSWVNDSDAGITGSLTTNYIPRATGASTLGNSTIFQGTRSLGFNTATPVDFGVGTYNLHLHDDGIPLLQFTNSTTGQSISVGSRIQLNSNDLLFINSQATGVFRWNTNGAERMRLHSTGNLHLGGTTDNGLRFQVTGDGFFSGSVVVASAAYAYEGISLRKNLTGLSIAYGVVSAGAIQSDVTSQAYYYESGARTQAASFTLPALYHYSANQSTFGAGSTVTSQYGFFAQSTLIGATNNYGFFGNIASGTGRWNLYMNGTAANYLNGSLGVGTTTMTYKFNVIDTGATYVAGFRGSASSYIVVGDTSLSGESGINLRNSTGQTFITQSGSIFEIGTLTGVNVIRFATGGTEAARITATNRNFHIGTFVSDSGERLQVNGTMRVSGASTFGDNSTISKNYNGETKLTISNTTTGDSSVTYISLVSSNGLLNIGKRSSTVGVYKFLAVNDSQIFNNTSGDIAILNDFASGSIKMAAGGSSTAHLTIASTGAATFSSTAQAAGFITSGGAGYAVINSASNTVTALRPTGGGTNIMSTNSNGLHIAVGTQAAGDLILASNNTERIRLSSNGFFSQLNATNPSASITDSYIQYSADVVAGNAAPHFRTENGAVIKLYQETTGVGNSIISLGGGNAVLDDTTFDGYTLRQIVKALRNQGILA